MLPTRQIADMRALTPDQIDFVSGGSISPTVPQATGRASLMDIHGFNPQPDPPAMPAAH